MTLDTAPIRLAAPQDARNLHRLTLIAFSRVAKDIPDSIAANAAKGFPDCADAEFVSKKDSSIRYPMTALMSLRVVAPEDRKARAFVYCVPPMDWIIAQGRPGKAALPTEDRIRLAGAMVECNLLATLPEWRGRGYASRLMADAEDRYRTAGYRVMVVVIDREHPEVVPWYRDRGYCVGEPDQHGLVTLWSAQKHRGLRYGDKGLLPGQRFAAKALVDHVQVSEQRGMVKVSGLFDGLPQFTPAAALEPEPVMQP